MKAMLFHTVGNCEFFFRPQCQSYQYYDRKVQKTKNNLIPIFETFNFWTLCGYLNFFVKFIWKIICNTIVPHF